MANILYLVHRMPYPPNKGDKVRSYHLLKHLTARHRVFLGTFVDDPQDEAHLDTVRALCTGAFFERLHPARAKLASLAALGARAPLALYYYRARALRRWVREVVQREAIDAAVVFSSSMAQYAEGLGVPVFVDFVDVDSAKWTEYASRKPWPLSWLYHREGERLLAYEREVAAWAERSFFVTGHEVELFRSLAPECAARVEVSCNGVDADAFSPDATRASPFAAGEQAVVFTGAMDYYPNEDAVAWFAREALPRIVGAWPRARLYIVGRNPAPALQALASPTVVVTGAVADVRPYLQHAAVVVAPLRIARGIQNKVLEGMAMARPVVASRACAQPLEAAPGAELVVADGAEGFAGEVGELLRDRVRAEAIGTAARARVLASYSWAAHLRGLERCLSSLGAAGAKHAPAICGAHP
jgi:sugar transferase (PEP-CTERM/EpsH1 system associated)